MPRTTRDVTAPEPVRVHLPSGFAPSGARHRAVCTCGWSTSARAHQTLAMAALVDGHQVDEPVCRLCERHRGDDTDLLAWRRHLRVLSDSLDGEFLACDDDLRTYMDLAAQRQVHLDRAAFEGLGMDVPAPQLRVLSGGGGVPGGQPK